MAGLDPPPTKPAAKAEAPASAESSGQLLSGYGNPNTGPAVDLAAMPRVLPRIMAMALAYRAEVALAIVCSLAAAIAGLTMPRLLGHGVDQAHRLLADPSHADAAQAALWTTAGLLILASTVRGCLTGFGSYVAEAVSQKVGYDLRIAFFQQLQRLSFSFHDKVHSGDLVTRGMLDLEAARAFIQGGMMQSLSLFMLLVVATTMMILRDPMLSLIALAFVPVALWSLARMGYLLRFAWMAVQQMMSILTRTMEENLQGIRVVRAFAGRDFEMAKFDEAANAALRLSYVRIIIRIRAVSLMTVSYYAAMAALLWFGGHRVIEGTMTVGGLTEFLTYMTLLQQPIRQISMIVASASRATSSGARLFEVLDLEPDIADAPGAQPLRPTAGVLQFDHVDFGYEPGKPILRDISFTVGAGETLGVVGRPGSGKSTIAQLIPRFYDVTGGRITIDGQDVRDVTLASLREYVGLVQQEAFLFDTSVGNNVAYADPWAETERIEDAARTAQIHDYVAGLPASYDTRVGERGVALSGGQRQRMSIARGVVPGPGVMIFDDSTAAIDAVTERRVREALAHATSAKATIIIAHRLSSLMHADEIIVIDEGAIVERGDHRSLVAAGGVYAELYALQTRTELGGVLGDEAEPPQVEETRA